MLGRLGSGLGVVLLVLGGVWSVGFGSFVAGARRVSEAPAEADGIVVLTGGAERIETALRLLSEGRAPALLISGVGRGNDLSELAHRLRLESALLDPATLGARVTLDYVAKSTLGNAAETAAWARRRAARRLIVVTAGYHMQRALLEIGHDLPEATLYPVAVQPPALRGSIDGAAAHLLATEFDKLLAVRLGLTRVGPLQSAR